MPVKFVWMDGIGVNISIDRAATYCKIITSLKLASQFLDIIEKAITDYSNAQNDLFRISHLDGLKDVIIHGLENQV